MTLALCLRCSERDAAFQCLRCLEERCHECFAGHAASCAIEQACKAYGINTETIGADFAAEQRRKVERERLTAKAAFDRAWADGHFSDEQREAAHAKVDETLGPIDPEALAAVEAEQHDFQRNLDAFRVAIGKFEEQERALPPPEQR